MALYIPHSILHLARLLYVRPETSGPYYLAVYTKAQRIKWIGNIVRRDEERTVKGVTECRTFTVRRIGRQVEDGG